MLSKAGGMMNRKFTGIRACVFDAYGTLFDVNSAAQRSQEMVGDKWQELADLWRTKQLQYTWLRSLAGDHIDFWQLTGEALDFALDSLKIGNAQLREHLMGLYLNLSAYPEVGRTLANLKGGGLKCAILSICFVSSNGWDAYSAKAFGFRVIWCNRYRQAPERIPEIPDAEILSLSGLPEIVGVP